MKKIILIISALVIGYIAYTRALPTLPTGTAPMTQAQVGIKNVQNVRIKSQNGTFAIIEVNNYNGTSTVTFPASLIDASGNKVPQINLNGCALIDVNSQAFVSIPLWAANIIRNTLGTAQYGILSPSGTLYTKLGFIKGGSGWQPGSLAYSNYLGNAPITPESNMPGAVNLVNICNGTCQPAE